VTAIASSAADGATSAPSALSSGNISIGVILTIQGGLQSGLQRLGLSAKQETLAHTQAEEVDAPPPSPHDVKVASLSSWVPWAAVSGCGSSIVGDVARCLAGTAAPEAAHDEPTYFVMAWDGPNEGKPNAEAVGLSHLHELLESGLVPPSVLVWKVAGGTVWMPLTEALAAHAHRSPSPAAV